MNTVEACLPGKFECTGLVPKDAECKLMLPGTKKLLDLKER